MPPARKRLSRIAQPVCTPLPGQPSWGYLGQRCSDPPLPPAGPALCQAPQHTGTSSLIHPRRQHFHPIYSGGNRLKERWSRQPGAGSKAMPRRVCPGAGTEGRRGPLSQNYKYGEYYINTILSYTAVTMEAPHGGPDHGLHVSTCTDRAGVTAQAAQSGPLLLHFTCLHSGDLGPEPRPFHRCRKGGQVT